MTAITKKSLKEAISVFNNPSAKEKSLSYAGVFEIKTEEEKTFLYQLNPERFCKILLDTDRPGDLNTSATIHDLKKLVKLSGELLEITRGENKNQVSAGTKKIFFDFLSDIDLPDYSEFNPGKDFSFHIFSAGELLEALEKAIVFTSRDTNRWALNGVCFSAQNNQLYLAGTDSKRLYYKIFDAEGITEGESILPNSAVKELVKLLKLCSKDDLISCSYADKDFSFQSLKFSYSPKNLDGRFPPFRQVIPGDLENTWQFNKKETLKEYNDITLTCKNLSFLHFKDNFVTALSEDHGQEYQERICGESSLAPETTDKNSFCLNYAFFKECVSVFGDTVSLSWNDPKSMAKITDANGDGSEAALLMPVSV